MNRFPLLDSFLEQVSQAYESLGDGVTIVDANNRLVYVNPACEKLYGYTKDELISESLSLVIPPDQFVVTEAMVRAAPNERWEGEVVRVRKGGERFPARLAIALLKNTEGEVVGTAGIVTDLTERKRAEERANQLGDIQKALANIGRIISSSLDIDEVYGRFALEVMKLIPFDRITINEVDVEQGSSVVTYQAGIDVPERRRGEVFALDGSTVGHVVLTRQGLLLNETDLANADIDFPGLMPSINAGMKSFMTVPLVSNDRVFGALVLRSQEANVYSDFHLRLAEQIADQIAGAIANARLYDELRMSEEALQESRDRVSTIFDIAEDAIVSIDDDQRITLFNRGAERIFGYPAEEVLDSPIDILLPSRLSEAHRQHIQQFVDSPSASKRMMDEREGRIIGVRKDGSEFLAEASISRVELNGKKTFTAILRDVTERIETEKQVKNLAHQHAALAEIGRIIGLSLDIDEVYEPFALEVEKLIPFDRVTIDVVDHERGVVILAYHTGMDVPTRNRGDAYSLAGTSTERAIHTQAGVLINVNDINKLTNEFPALSPGFEAGIRSFMTLPLISRGEVIGGLHLRSKKQDAYDEKDFALAQRIADQIAGAIANSQLYEESHRAMEALKETEEKYRALVENANDAIVVLQDGKTVYRNPLLERALGYTLDESGEQSFLDLVAPEDRERVNGYYQQLLRGEDAPDQYEVRLVTRDGQRVVMEAKPRIIEYGGRPATLVVMRDVTERNLLQQQLLHSQKMEAIGTLAGGVAHDFNNMLSAIMSYTQLASAKAPSDGPIIGYLEEVQKAAERSANLTRQLLAFSRQHIAEPRILNLNRVLTGIEKMLRRLISEDIELITEADENLGSVIADPGQLEQVLMNLVVNARDAMPNGGRLIIETANDSLDESFVSQYPDLIAGDYVTLCISDTGVGMTEEIKSRIFEPFFTTKEVDQGTGLGLSTCYGIVSQIGGRIIVESEPGHGATFKIYLPRVFEDSVDVHDSNASDNLPTGSERVLVVEDELSLRKVTADVLREQGYTVLEAESGEDALALAELPDAGLIDLLVTDLIMPGMDGKALAGRIKQLNSGTKILYTSGYASDSRIRQEVSQEGTEFMPKPFTPTILANTVRRLLDGE